MLELKLRSDDQTLTSVAVVSCCVAAFVRLPGSRGHHFSMLSFWSFLMLSESKIKGVCIFAITSPHYN